MKRMLFPMFISILFVLIGCNEKPSEKALLYEENNEIIGAERDELIGEISDSLYNSIDRDNSEAEEIISAIERQGKDIIPKEGRYIIGAGVNHDVPQSGRVLVYDENNILLIDELLDEFRGVSSVAINLNGSHIVHFDGITQAFLTPVATEISNELNAGIWEVGIDIEAGNYSVMPADFGFGYLQIYEEGEAPRVFEFLDGSDQSKIEVLLVDGQIIKITGLNMLQFEIQS